MKQTGGQWDDKGRLHIEVELDPVEANVLGEKSGKAVKLSFVFDIPPIINNLGRRAIWNTRRKATVYHGRISVKATEG